MPNQPAEGMSRSETQARELLADIYTPEGAEIWLSSRNRMFGMERPIDLLQSDETAVRVLEVLGGLASGSFW